MLESRTVKFDTSQDVTTVKCIVYQTGLTIECYLLKVQAGSVTGQFNYDTDRMAVVIFHQMDMKSNESIALLVRDPGENSAFVSYQPFATPKIGVDTYYEKTGEKMVKYRDYVKLWQTNEANLQRLKELEEKLDGIKFN